jgi:hypothetical protein
MAGQVIPNKNLGALRPMIWWGVAAFGALALVYLIAGRIASIVTRWPPTIHEAVAPSHCAQFIGIAKAAYGNDWRVRLDPRDTTCDNEVRAEWERQRLPRTAPVYETAQPMTSPAPQVLVAVRPSAPDTYCLNVISLAKVKHGAEWRTKLSSAEASACAREAGVGQ